MSDILPQIEPETQGRVEKLDVPLSKYLSESFHAGQDDSMFHAVSSLTEDHLANNPANSKQLTAEEANNKYAIGSLKFNQPVTESLASMMAEREKTKMDQQMYLSSGATKARFLPGMAAGILGATANPLDLGSMFIPFVGEGKAVAEAGIVGRILSRGLIPAETIARTGVPVPKLIGAMAQAGMWQGMAEVPKMIESHYEGQPMPHIGADEIGQMGLAALFHGLGEGLKMLRPETHDAMIKQATNDFLEDKDTTAHTYIPLDEHVLDYKLRQEAQQHFDEQLVNRSIFKELDERAIIAAVKNNQTGEIVTGASHEATGLSGQPHWEDGFVTDKGKFVDRDQAGHLAGTDAGYGYNHSILDTDNKMFAGKHDQVDPTLLGDNNEADYYNHLTSDIGLTHEEAMQKVLEHRQETRMQRFVGSPEGQARKDDLRRAAIEKWVEDKKKELANPVPKQVRETARTPITDPKVVESHTGDHAKLSKQLEDDIHGLGGKTPDEQKVDQEKDPIHNWLDNAIKSLESDPTKLHIDPFLLKTIGAPVLRTILIATREAYKVSKDLMQAIRQAFAEHKIENPEAERQLFSALTKGDDFRYSIQAELDKPQPFNVKPERFTAQVILSRLQQMPAPERAILKNAGIDEFLKQYGTQMVDRAQLSKFVDAHMPQFEIRPMLNVADENITNYSKNEEHFAHVQHQLETAGYKFEGYSGEITGRPAKETEANKKLAQEFLDWAKEASRIENGESGGVKGDKLVGDFVSQNVSVPIAFEKMENPRTIFLAAPQDVHVGSSHYSDVFPRKGKGKQPNMIAWAETHVVTMPDGRRVLHVFEEQSDVEQGFEVGEYHSSELPRFDSEDEQERYYADQGGKAKFSEGPPAFTHTAYYIDAHGESKQENFRSKSEAQKFVDQKLDEYRDRVQPLIKDHKQILLKAATKLAMREKLDGVVISDPRTAMLTQGHLGEVEPEKRVVDSEGNKHSGYEPPSQAGGMQQAYGQELPRIMEKITGQRGEPVDMGQKHYQSEEEGEGEPLGDNRPNGPTEREEFDKAFPGSENISGNFFPTKHLDPNKPFEVFTPKQAAIKVPESIDTAVNCILEKLL